MTSRFPSRSLLAAPLALLAALPGVAAAAQPACITPAEASAVATYALPSAITGLAKQCEAALAPSAYLRTDGDALAARYARTRQQTWPVAKGALLKMNKGLGGDAGAGGNLFAKLPDASLQQMADALIEGLVAQKVPVEDCGRADMLVMALAPLPAENFATAMSVLLGLVGKTSKLAPGKAKAGPFTLCPR